MRVGLNFSPSLIANGNGTSNKKCTVTIHDQQSTAIHLNDQSKNSFNELSDAIKRCEVKLHESHFRWYNKKVFIVTKVFKTTNNKVLTSKVNNIGTSATVLGRDLFVSHKKGDVLRFNYVGSLAKTFAIEALCCDVSLNGILINPVSVQSLAKEEEEIVGIYIDIKLQKGDNLQTGGDNDLQTSDDDLQTGDNQQTGILKMEKLPTLPTISSNDDGRSLQLTPKPSHDGNFASDKYL